MEPCPWNCDHARRLPYLRECCSVGYANRHCPANFKVVTSECTGFALICNSQGTKLRWRKSFGYRFPEHGWQEPCVGLRNPAEAYGQGNRTTRDLAASAKRWHCQQNEFNWLQLQVKLGCFFPIWVAKICSLRCNIRFSMACAVCVADYSTEIPWFGWGEGRSFPRYCT